MNAREVGYDERNEHTELCPVTVFINQFEPSGSTTRELD
jgi:hypothetical protein